MTSDGTNTYQWDAENRLIQINYPGTGNYSGLTYDAYGQLSKVVEVTNNEVVASTQLVIGLEGLSESRNSTGSLIGQLFNFGQLTNGNSYFVSKNILSIVEMSDSSGNVVASVSYDPWGNQTVLSENGTMPTFGFQGMYRHTQSNLNLTLYRPYSPKLGRFLSRDLVGSGSYTSEFVNAFETDALRI
jgi:RHS repeat-associated protein